MKSIKRKCFTPFVRLSHDYPCGDIAPEVVDDESDIVVAVGHQ
ncbi:MAG: hypothetical protein R2860_08390 [Desulfobacterales bacterium]